MIERYVYCQVLLIFLLIQLLSAEFISYNNLQRGDGVPAIEQRSLSLDNPKLTRFGGTKENRMMIQAAILNSGRFPFGDSNQRYFANLINLQRLQKRMSDEQKLKNILRASANNGDFVRHGRQNLGKIPGAIENRNTGIFGKITKEDLGQQLSLKQILEQEKSILELLERDSQHKQLLQSNRLDLKDVQERQQRIINLLISQQRGNNDDQIDSSIVNSGNNLYNPEEKTAAEETFLSTVEDLGESGKQFQVEKLIQIPIVEQLSGKVSPREGQFLQISPYKLGKNLRNNVGPSFQVVQVADKSSEEVNNKGALMLIQQNGQQTAEIYGNEEVNVQQKVENLSGDNDSVETFSVEERDALNTAMPS